MISVFLPLTPMAKARPRVTRHGTYMPKPYMLWRTKFVILINQCRDQVVHLPIIGPVRVGVMVHTKSGNCRPDLDNVFGACADALQDARWIENDRQIKAGVFGIQKSNKPGIEITIESIPMLD